MNLYLLTQRENTGYDTYDSVVVAAVNVFDALHMNPRGELYGVTETEDWSMGNSWATHPKNVTCQCIGVADPLFELPDVVIASFNAG